MGALQANDMVWAAQPGAPTLTPTRLSDVRRIDNVGFVSVHTLQGSLPDGPDW